MHTHVAFLRGINVGGRTVRNDRLCELFESCGLEEPQGFLASGNVLFRVARDDDGAELAERAGSEGPTPLEARIEACLEDGLGYAVRVFTRTASEVVAVAEHSPLPDSVEGGKVHIAFLRQPPTTALQEEVAALAAASDHVAFSGREMYWRVAGRFLDSALSGPAVGRALGAEWTLRTANTVRRIAARVCG